MCFIGYRHATGSEIYKLLQQFKYGKTYYFLRWTHNVSGIVGALPEDNFPSPEGQLFNHKLELRWKHKKDDLYDILILSRDSLERTDFTLISGEWETYDQPAHCYKKNETRFSKGFVYQNEQGDAIDPRKLPIQQRYFRDAKTATVHFIALTLTP